MVPRSGQSGPEPDVCPALPWASRRWGILDNHCNVIPPTSLALVTVFQELDSLLETNAEKGLALGKPSRD